eukprot:TRINITY_DN4629_c0_g2_i6.p1 TRINITY_DN4629_c0_g2~~TRINITY_DN4629_c0_g2_i6.p1  ORF type:complete len:172 (-),score=32.99 TRINITY_DN4629_c0_g2_i6:283-798(-)
MEQRLSLSEVINQAEQLLEHTWKRLQQTNPQYYSTPVPSFKIQVNSKERFCKYGLLSCPVFTQFSPVQGTRPLHEAVKEFCKSANELKAEFAAIKDVSYTKNYMNIEVYGQNAIAAEESKDSFDPVTSLYTTVVYDGKGEPTFLVRPIGYIESCFREKFGTPRQGRVGVNW